MIPQNLQVIQLVNSDGNYAGLYLTMRDDIENFQSDFDAAFSAVGEADDIDSEADDWLAAHKRIYRCWVEEVTTENI